ncbi:albusnodin/ikarugamycin family macrolactam cyclase [Streptomyces sp. NBC_00102]|uniref:albusnodin/ikarugamycin family macrolactam cyclase n=1 Tax=Streptomyces sp. NBC_00102 TaxID=2975652 RepID=UPI002250B85B|nr:albusnodin/ikarugamycin family macrolactam cyclase [Streptomyces sp. NBC_00102]MCX5401314.1 albusnodin/ikarugamycin family macrolactam cyclase [Streptomyces sp. NBC_00102]
MVRFVAGKFTASTESSSAGVRPRAGTEILNRPRTRAWAIGHGAGETEAWAASDGTDALLVTAGHCLAGQAEQRAALAAARAGDLGPAVRLPGAHLSLMWADGELRVAGDRAGVIPVYWLRHDGVLWWSTAAAALAALAGTGANLPVLLADLTLTGVDTQSGQAHFEGVRRVPPGHTLILRDNAEPHIAPVNEPNPHSFEQGVRRLRAALTLAVERRAQAYERITADLSGGMDSTTVACLAARNRPVLAVTYTDAHLADDDDLLYARRVAAETGGITHQVIDARHTGVAQFDGLADPAELPFTDTPSLALGMLAVKEAQLAPVAAYGTQAHLTGRGGDNVLATEHSHYVDQFLARGRLPALRGAASYARAQRVAPWRVWRQLGLTAATAYPRALEHLAGTISGPDPLVAQRAARWQNLAWCSVTSAAGWLTPAGRRLVAGLAEQRAQAADPHATPAALHDRQALEFMGASHTMFDSIARQKWGIPIHAPFLDTAVVDACLNIPSYQRVREGEYKPLAQAAFTGLVPDFLLRRQTKTAFTTSLYTGLAANAPVLRRIITTSHLAQAGLINTQRATADLDTAIAGAPAPLADLHTLLVTELWLARLPTTTVTATWWQPDTDRSSSCG